MITQDQLLEKYNITGEDFAKTTLEWSALEAIYADHESKSGQLLTTGNLISENLRQIKEVHSLKMRIKEPDHLIAKIIRKKIKEPERDINLENYEGEITDLIGVRALHLFKDEWVGIHEAITDIFEVKEGPVANIRKGDPDAIFKEHGGEIVEHPAGYRSVHYLVESKPTKKLSIAEIQVRTIFEEGWSEIDHQLRYPHDVDNMLLSQYLAMFNRLAGSADEMGTFIKLLKKELERRELDYKTELEAREAEKVKIIQDLESIKQKLKAESAERKKLEKTIESLQKSKPAPPAPRYTSGLMTDMLGIDPASGLGMVGMMNSGLAGASFDPQQLFNAASAVGNLMGGLGATGLTNTITCKYCGKRFTSSPTRVQAFEICPHCGKSQT